MLSTEVKYSVRASLLARSQVTAALPAVTICFDIGLNWGNIISRHGRDKSGEVRAAHAQVRLDPLHSVQCNSSKAQSGKLCQLVHKLLVPYSTVKLCKARTRPTCSLQDSHEQVSHPLRALASWARLGVAQG